MIILGVQVARAQPLRVGDRTVASGIDKRPVRGAVTVRPLGLEGDEQADPTVHGGLAKAVYAYPFEHYAYWQDRARELHGRDAPLPHGSLGENLTLAGLLETELFVGDVLRLPNCALRVTQPRKPCFKLNAHMDDPLAARRMQQSRYCGFYLAVDEPGTLAAGDPIELVPGRREVALLSLFKFPRAASW